MHSGAHPERVTSRYRARWEFLTGYKSQLKSSVSVHSRAVTLPVNLWKWKGIASLSLSLVLSGGIHHVCSKRTFFGLQWKNIIFSQRGRVQKCDEATLEVVFPVECGRKRWSRKWPGRGMSRFQTAYDEIRVKRQMRVFRRIESGAPRATHTRRR